MERRLVLTNPPGAPPSFSTPHSRVMAKSSSDSIVICQSGLRSAASHSPYILDSEV
jgi:hypothetical protein